MATDAAGGIGAADGIDAAVVRRAPFSDNPTVGPRGQRTQQRILDAALHVLRDEGYHRCSVEQIAKRAGCSRVSFYQYFSGKEDVYYDLAGQVARQVRASVEALELLQSGPTGWSAARTWVKRSGDIFERYGAVFDAFEVAAERAESVAAMRGTADANVASIRAKLTTVRLPGREIDAVLDMLLAAMVRTFHLAGVLRSRAPAAYPRERIEDALTDVFHRTLFGLEPGVNARQPEHEQSPVLEFDPATRSLLTNGGALRKLSEGARPAVESLLAAGREVFVRRGYHGARVDDIVAAAGMSHGAFYQYFKNKDDFAHVLVIDAMRPLAGALAEISPPGPDGTIGTVALRRWLRQYNASHVNEAAIIRVWVDATNPDAALVSDAAPAVDWGRRRMARLLRPRGFGDIDADALVMVGLLDAFGSRPRPAITVDAVAQIIQRGLLGRVTPAGSVRQA
jgi:AcrR family transcriptional regulator